MSVEQDYMEIDPKVFPDHILREDIDECRFDKASGSYGKNWYQVKGIKGATVKKHCDSYSFRCLKKDHPATVVQSQKATVPIKPEAGKTYLTAGGYVVKMKDEYNTIKETSPGINVCGETISQACVRVGRETGWRYDRNGTIAMNGEWGTKLRIVEQLPFSLPTLPTGYLWAGGYPQFRTPVKGEHFIRYHQESGFGGVAKCDGNFNVPYGSENRRLIVESTTKEVFVGEGYRKLKPEEYFSPGSSHECCKLCDLGTSKEEWIRVVWRNLVSGSPEWVFREKVVASQPISTDDMVEVTNLKEYIVQKDDVYFPINHKPCSVSELPGGPYRVSWYEPTTKLFATKKNYGDYVFKNSLKPVAEGSQIGEGYRKIDYSIDTPQEGDQYWSQLNNQWLDRPVHYGAFNHIDIYRRKIDDWVILDPKIYGDYVPKAGYEYKKQKDTRWESMTGSSYHPIKHWEECGYIFRCKKANVPIVNALPINNRADAAQISGVACATPPNKFQVQENEMNSPKSEETVKFETAKKLAVATAKLGGKMIWRTADYFVFAPIKKAASPFMWMVRYAVLGTMAGGGVYACTNPDDAKELLWKCVPKISISIDAPEVLG